MKVSISAGSNGYLPKWQDQITELDGKRIERL